MRTKLKTLALLGMLVVIVPFFGIPFSWKQWALVLIGLIITWLAYSLRPIPSRGESSTTPVYTENGKR
ncbi:hypothetical protein L0Y40_01035 [Candidatus Wolfebacteria bacterium]|nr:hypothetical protein [Candidatus Wolfebacteria bacterium]